MWCRKVAGFRLAFAERCAAHSPARGALCIVSVSPMQVMCVIMKTPDRVDWKLCAASRDEEEQQAAKFKAALEKHVQQ